MTERANVVICGAGIAGIAAAYHLAVRQGIADVVLVDDRPPLTLTSDKSTECYRNWWPGPGDTMVRFMNRSIDLLEALADESDNYFHLNRRGYVFLTADPRQAAAYRASAEAISALGAGPLRIHDDRAGEPYRPFAAEGYKDQPDGADLLLDPALIQQHFPFVNPETIAALHPRRCGWLSAQQLGMYLLDQARAHGARLLRGRVAGVGVENGRVHAVHVRQESADLTLRTPTFVNAAGPLVQEVAQMLGVTLPVFNELHGKIAFEDTLGIVPRALPLMIWSDPVALPWSAEERAFLAESAETRWLLQEFPGGAHFRPEGGPGAQTLLLLWTYHVEPQEPTWPTHFEPEYGEVVIRGLTRMIPALSAYLERLSKPVIDGGYYCKTQENRPLIGPLPVDGAFIIGALSGYGIMACMAAGELLAAHVAGAPLPDYAPAFLLSRYADPDYQARLASWDATSGQL
ncbi:MAG: FAD-binding oxidoreductase [Anaerolineales bacterium]|nr:FAD-binding oxidoreductase [Anaerolineales bacterium]